MGVTDAQPSRTVKAILQVLDEDALLTSPLLELTRWMADYYLCGWGQVLNVVVPAGVKKQAGTRAVPFLELVPEALLPKDRPHLPPKQKKVLEYLHANPVLMELRTVMDETETGLNWQGKARAAALAARRRRGVVPAAVRAVHE